MNSLPSQAQTPPICPNPSGTDESKWMWSEVCLSDMNKRSPPRCHLLHHHSRGLPYLGQYCSRTCPPLGKTERMWGDPLLCYAGALTVFRWNPLRQIQLTEYWRVGHIKQISNIVFHYLFLMIFSHIFLDNNVDLIMYLKHIWLLTFSFYFSLCLQWVSKHSVKKQQRAYR